MKRFLSLGLISLVAAGAWRREAFSPDQEPRRSEVRTARSEGRSEQAVTHDPPETSGRFQAEGVEREVRLQQRVAALESALQEALHKVDEHRAKLARAYRDQRDL